MILSSRPISVLASRMVDSKAWRAGLPSNSYATAAWRSTHSLSESAPARASPFRVTSTADSKALVNPAIADTTTTQGIVALFERPPSNLDAILESSGPVVVLDGVQDPGNVGAIVRLATAFDAAGVVALSGTADPYSPADFQHGPMALIEHGYPVLAIIPDGVVAQETLDQLGQLRDWGAELIVISPLHDALAMAHTPLPLPAGMPEWLSPLVAVLPGQVFALGLTLSKGLDPDHPRGLRKVTLTR